MPGLDFVDVPVLIVSSHLVHQSVKVLDLRSNINLLHHHIARLSKAGVETVLDFKPLGHLRVSWEEPLWLIFLTTIQLYSASDEELLMQIVALIERTRVNKHLKQWLQIHSNGLILQKDCGNRIAL